MGDTHLADDVAQAVFLILAEKASSLAGEQILSRWLLASVGYVSANALKAQRRRLRRETGVAVALDAEDDCCSADPAQVLIWREIRTKVDDAVLSLPRPDRQAVLLRYFQEQPIREIALAMRVSEDAVKQRLTRATGKLRQRLARYHLSLGLLSAEQFTRFFESNLVKSGGAGLSRLPGSVPLRDTASTSAKTISKGALNMMKWTQIKVAAAVAVIVIGGAGGLMQLRRASADNPDNQAQKPSASTSPAGAQSNGDQSNLERLLHAVQVNDRDAFTKDATPAMSQAITSAVLEGVSKDLSPHLAAGYTLVHFGDLRQVGDSVQIWKVSFKDGRDDALVKISTNNGKLDGFFIQ
jgi:RNA polymerase sigma factor (sigma-70 family)